MTQPVRIMICLEGGIIQSIATLGVSVEVVVIDYDVEGGDPSELANVPQGRQLPPQSAYVSTFLVDRIMPEEATFLEPYWEA